MLAAPSPYLSAAAALRENGYHVLPVMPGSKVPGQWSGGTWRPMPAWARYCDQFPPDFVHEQWARWPDAGLCLAHGAVVGLDLDTDRADVRTAIAEAVESSPVKRFGATGWMGYYRAGDGLGPLGARVNWYDPRVMGPDGKPSRSPLVQLLLHGTQSVLPPSIHPDTGQAYRWLTPDTLEDMAPGELPVMDAGAFAALDAALRGVGLTREAPRTAREGAPAGQPAGHDLEKPFWRSLNDRALEPAALDAWFPALGLPKTRQRGRNGWEAVASWRASGSGRALHERNPNLRAMYHGGIRDFGTDEGYTAVDLVMAAHDCTKLAAKDWLEPFLRPEEGAGSPPPPSPPPRAPEAPPAPASPPGTWQGMPAFCGQRARPERPRQPRVTEDDWRRLIPPDPGPFPIPDYASACRGMLGRVAGYLDRASPTATEAGGLAVALPLLGALMGRAYASPTDLRTNIYTVALGASGTGKTGLVSPAKELLRLARAEDVLGTDRIKSGSGLLGMLRAGRPKVCFLDEFGHMLKQLASPGAGIHSREIVTEFTALYSAANTIFAGTAYADGRDNSMDCPHLCLFGMATPGQFWDAFGSSALEDGSVARFLVFPIGEADPKDPDKDGREAVGAELATIAEAVAGRVRGNLGQAPVCAAGITDDAETAREALVRTMNACADYAEEAGVKGGPAILRRVAENAVKIALVSAVGRDPVAPVIDADDFDIGHALARWSATVMIGNIASHIADNQYERDVNDVERFIKSAGDRGRTAAEIQARFKRLPKRARNEIIEALEDADLVKVEVVQNPLGGRPRKVIRAAG